MKRDQKIVHDELSQVKKALNRVQNQIHQEGALSAIIGLALQATLEILHLERTQDSLLDILVDTHHGKISPELISPSQLQKELLTIKANLPSNLKLPASTDELLNFYKLMAIEGRATEKYVIFRIKIPLLATDFYELLRLFPVPWAANEGYFKIKSNVGFLITNLHRDHYLPLKESEFSSCALSKEETYMCHQIHPLHKVGSSEAACEIQLLSHNATTAACSIEATNPGPHWIQLQNPNIWIYSVKNNYTLNAVCGTTPINLMLHNAGILTVNGECNIKQPLVTIQGHKNFESQIHKFYMPSMNLTNMIQQPHEQIKIQGNMSLDDATLDQLHSKLYNLSRISSTKLRSHDIHHYSISYVTLTLIIIGFSLLLWYWKKWVRTPKDIKEKAAVSPENSPTAINEEHELTVITVYDA